VKRTLKRRLKVLEIVKREPNRISVHFQAIQLLNESYVLFLECKKPTELYIIDFRGALHLFNEST